MPRTDRLSCAPDNVKLTLVFYCAIMINMHYKIPYYFSRYGQVAVYMLQLKRVKIWFFYEISEEAFEEDYELFKHTLKQELRKSKDRIEHRKDMRVLDKVMNISAWADDDAAERT